MISDVFKIISGIRQTREGKRIDDTRPTYNIPAEMQQKLNMQRSRAMDVRMPGQSVAEDRISRSTGTGINALRELGGTSANRLQGITDLARQEQDSMNMLGVQGAQYQLQNEQLLGQGLSEMAAFRDQEFDYNQNQPFLDRLSRKRALLEGGNQNIYGGMKGFEDKAEKAAQLLLMGMG